ncbi:MAG: helix-turn-helix domain-containing protein [Coriobacteriaceae bacterium]|nr:helix-turn-helix domain-containing protein [Coriobacteriaceae bacterium]
MAAYLNSGRNVARAASALHVHKNSMYYRIQRIEELAGVDLSDEQTCFLLQLSLAMLGQGPTSR